MTGAGPVTSPEDKAIFISTRGSYHLDKGFLNGGVSSPRGREGAAQLFRLVILVDRKIAGYGGHIAHHRSWVQRLCPAGAANGDDYSTKGRNLL
jgi:hypothetical protein